MVSVQLHLRDCFPFVLLHFSVPKMNFLNNKSERERGCGVKAYSVTEITVTHKDPQSL